MRPLRPFGKDVTQLYDVIVKNGKIVTSSRIYEGDICIQDGRVAAILSPGTRAEAKDVLDASGKLVLPGAIDTHAHLNDPGFTWREDFDHGTAAAALGGVTTIIDMPLQNEPAMGSVEIMDKKLEAVGPQAHVDYCFWGAMLKNNLEHLVPLAEAGVAAFKCFLGPVSPDYDTLTLGQVRQEMIRLKGTGVRMGFHCEDFSIIKACEAARSGDTRRDFLDSRPVSAEIIAVQGIIALARELEVPVHICHVSHPDVAQVIREAQNQGVDVTAETCPHYLIFSEDEVLEHGVIFKCAPPLRPAKARDRLWDYVADNTLSCVCSDHSPCAPEEKDEEKLGVFGAWTGMSGIQFLLTATFDRIVHQKGWSPTMAARVLSEGPAKAFGIWERKGSIEVGKDADLVIMDPEAPWEITADSILQLNQISSFVGLTGRGVPAATLVRGTVVARDGKVCGPKGYGQLVKRTK